VTRAIPTRSEHVIMTYAPIESAPINVVATTTLTLTTRGEGFTNFTSEVRRFLEEAGGISGTINLFIRHTSASLTIQENADPDVLTDLTTALRRVAPDNAGWIHATEGPDDMPAHIKTMLTSCSLQIPVIDGAMALGTWQGIYLIEHRARPHRREVVMQFIGSRS
jgi:secondary thiamine-phosphate synthase enzyme